MALEFGKNTSKGNFTVLIWGTDGVGKTPTLLYLARSVGPAAIVDADGGLVPYLKGEDGNHVKTIESEDPIYVRTQLEELAANPGQFKMAGIDPLSTIYQNLLNLVEQRERSKKPVHEFESALHIGSWNPIKNHNRDLMRLIRWIGMPMICTAREDNLWKGGKVAGARPAGDKALGHEFTLNIRMTQPVPGGPRFADLIRDRLCRFPQRLEAPSDDPFFVAREILRLYPERFGGQAVAKEHCSDQVALEIHHLIREMGLPHKKVIERIRVLGADLIEELSPEAGGEVLDGLRTAYAKRHGAAKDSKDKNKDE